MGSGVLTAMAIETRRSVLSYRRFGGLFSPEDEDMLLINVGQIPTTPHGVTSERAVSYHRLYVGVITENSVQKKQSPSLARTFQFLASFQNFISTICHCTILSNTYTRYI
jgi:hypothetical protein